MGKRKHTEIALSDENNDDTDADDALLELGKERLKAAQAELALAQRNVINVAQSLEDIRQKFALVVGMRWILCLD